VARQSTDGRLSSLISVRAELGRGDLRALYLGWLQCAQTGDPDDDDLEPPVPAGLAQLSASRALPRSSDDPDLIISINSLTSATAALAPPSLTFGPVGKLMDAIMVRKKWDSGIKGFFAGLKHYVQTGRRSSAKV